jgi:hypothetical protein
MDLCRITSNKKYIPHTKTNNTYQHDINVYLVIQTPDNQHPRIEAKNKSSNLGLMVGCRIHPNIKSKLLKIHVVVRVRIVLIENI